MQKKDFTRFLIWELIIIVGILAVIGGGIFVDAHYSTSAKAELEPALMATPRPTATLPQIAGQHETHSSLPVPERRTVKR